VTGIVCVCVCMFVCYNMCTQWLYMHVIVSFQIIEVPKMN